MSHLTNYENRSLINTNNGKRIAAGLNFVTNDKGEETVVVSGDFYGTGLDQEEFTNLIAQTYQKHNVISKCEEQGWYVEDENVTVDANGKIVINAYRFA